MTPRHVAKTFAHPHFAAEHYENSVESEVEHKVELFCKKIKDRIMGRNKDGK